jgi:predicted phage terminase large subunit-like protein
VEGNLIRHSWIKIYEQVPTLKVGDQIVQSWDMASTLSEAGDYTVGTTWLKRRDDYYLLDTLRGRWEYPEVRRRVVQHAQHHGAKMILIEKAGPGFHLLQDLCSSPPPGMPRPVGIVPQGSKVDRMAVRSCRFEAGQVWFPRDAEWLAPLLDELLAFPAGKHDDQVDSISQFLNWASNRRIGPRLATFPGMIIHA